MPNDVKITLIQNTATTASEIYRASLRTGGFRKITSGLVNRQFTVTQGIPINLLEEIGKNFTKGITQDNLGRNIVNTSPGLFTDYKQAGDAITAPIFRFGRLHYAYYVGTLRALQNIVNRPGVAAARHDVGFSKNIHLNLSEAYDPKLKQVDLQVPFKWRALSKLTLKQKGQLGYSPVFWKHTTQGARAFNALASARISSVSPRLFIRNIKAGPVSLSNVSSARGPNRYIPKASYTFALGVPLWNQKMDALFTVPFTTSRPISPAQSIGINPRSSIQRSGIDRFIAAESFRPLFRPVALAAGRSLRNYIKTSNVAAYSQGQLVEAANKHASTLADKAKKVRKNR